MTRNSGKSAAAVARDDPDEGVPDRFCILAPAFPRRGSIARHPGHDLKLATFISTQMETILSEWERFAASLGAVTRDMDSLQLRDHARKMLEAIVLDIQTPQSDQVRIEKGKGHLSTASRALTAATVHGTGRHQDGFSLLQLTSEFRALRSSVLAGWLQTVDQTDAPSLAEMVRFNEAIDQAIAESVEEFTTKSEQARDVFLAMLGHDLRSPLQAILMTAGYFERADLDPARSITSAIRIKRNVASMATMVNDLLEYSRLQLGGAMPMVRLPADFAEICRRAVDDARAAHPACSIGIDADLPAPGDFDANRLAQMLANLLNNACQYATRGTTITLSVRQDHAGIIADVHNHGAVIPEASLESIFNPLVQLEVDQALVDRPRTSVGLGLFIAQQIAEAHGGRIDVQSGEGIGTTFSIHLPRVDGGSSARQRV